jgi:hypothetical protein
MTDCVQYLAKLHSIQSLPQKVVRKTPQLSTCCQD